MISRQIHQLMSGRFTSTCHTATVNQGHELLLRRAEPLVREALMDTRVVAINGARQVGKSTLARALASSLPDPAGLSDSTVRRYLELLAAVFLIKEIPAWSGGPTQRAVGTPKLGFVDSGIACHLIGQDVAG